MLISLVDRGFSLSEIYKMSVNMVFFLSKVNNRLKEIETINEIQTSVAANGRQMDDMTFSSFSNKLRYG